MGEKNCGSKKNRQAKNGGVEGGSWRESHREAGGRESLTGKLVRSRQMWAGHVERMEGIRLAKRVDVLRVEGRRRRGRPRLRWEDCVKRDLMGVGVENEGEG